MTRTVVVGLLLAFLLFTPQGHYAALMGLALSLKAIHPRAAPDPVVAAPKPPVHEYVNESGLHDAAHPYVSMEAFCRDHWTDSPDFCQARQK